MSPSANFSEQNFVSNLEPKSKPATLEQLDHICFHEQEENPSKDQIRCDKIMQAAMQAVSQDLGCSVCTAHAMVEDQGIDTLTELIS